MMVLSKIISSILSPICLKGPTPGGGQDHVGVLGRGGDGGDPVGVAG